MELVERVREVSGGWYRPWMILPKADGPLVDQLRDLEIPYSVMPMPRGVFSMSRSRPLRSLVSGALAWPAMRTYFAKLKRLLAEREPALATLYRQVRSLNPPRPRDFLAPYPDAEVIECDALASKSALHADVLERLPDRGPWTLCANLPYSISGPLLATAAQLEHPPSRVCCLVQKEVAERLAAEPGSAAWGPLSAAFQEVYSVRLGRSVPPQLFWPRPKVDSAVFLADLAGPPAPLALRVRRIAFYRELMQRRRKTLRRVLADMVGSDVAAAALEAAGIDGKRRAETLSLSELRALEQQTGGDV